MVLTSPCDSLKKFFLLSITERVPFGLMRPISPGKARRGEKGRGEGRGAGGRGEGRRGGGKRWRMC
jgi:hypothetical protein